MGLKNVFIVYDCAKFSKQMIVDDMRSEGFRHYFKFYTDLKQGQLETYISSTDEVWVFGDVEGISAYNMAVAEGKEIWKMA